MIDLDNLINTKRSRPELEAWLLFCVTTAAASAETQAAKFNRFLQALGADAPFDGIRAAERRGDLGRLLAASKLGKYDRLHRSFVECTALDPAAVTVAELERITGIGRKTARLFLLYSRPDQRFAALDVHILRHLKGKFPGETITPLTEQRYARLQTLFLRLADEAGVSPVEYDRQIWNSLRQRGVVGGHAGGACDLAAHP